MRIRNCDGYPPVDVYIHGGNRWMNQDQVRMRVQWGRLALQRGEQVDELTRELIEEDDVARRSTNQSWERYLERFRAMQEEDNDSDNDHDHDSDSDSNTESDTASDNASDEYKTSRLLKRRRMAEDKEERVESETTVDVSDGEVSGQAGATDEHDEVDVDVESPLTTQAQDTMKP
ncbi:hypothetical protein VNI00_007300 [Paramarasmius palmivorus]|uniref:Uncharacterized protein n=1 Tax=Paramarasmius palmivorus TaxID=297713 RepID=A0AAW0D0F0_9AGAR